MKKEIRVRCWIEIGGVKHFGPGPAELLERIHQSGSISRAAKEMDMSYKKAWDIIEKVNTRGKQPYVVLRHGGKHGGGAELTPVGKKVVASFRKLTDRIQKVVDKDQELLRLI